MLIVLALASSAPHSRDTKYPQKNPEVCNARIDAISLVPETARTILAFADEIVPHMSETNRTDRKGVIVDMVAEVEGN